MILFELYVSVTKEVKKKLLGRPDGHHGPKCGQADWCFNWKIHSHFCHIISSKLWTTCVSHIWHGHAQVLGMHIVGRYEYLTPTNIESYQLYVCVQACVYVLLSINLAKNCFQKDQEEAQMHFCWIRVHTLIYICFMWKMH